MLVVVHATSGECVAFRDCLVEYRGETIFSNVSLPGSEEYAVRMGYNFQPNLSDHPVVFVDAHTERDIQAAILCAKKFQYPVCPRSGGHSRLGSGMCSGVVIDVGSMNKFELSGDRRVMTVGPGQTLGSLSYNLYTQGRRVFPVGKCASVGIGGFILAGGFSELSSRLGLGCDNLLEIKMVQANGQIVVANKYNQPHVLWASCGGGGGRFGIVYEMKLLTHSALPYENFVGFTADITGDDNIISFMMWFMTWKSDATRVTMHVKIITYGSELYSGRFLEIKGACFLTSFVPYCEDRLAQDGFFNFPFAGLDFRSGTSALYLLRFFADEDEWTDASAFLHDGDLYHDGRLSPLPIAVSGIAFRYGNSSESVPDQSFLEGLLRHTSEVCGSIKKCVTIFEGVGKQIRSVPVSSTAIYGLRLASHWVSLRVYTEASLDWANTKLIALKEFLAPHTIGSFLNYEDVTLENYADAYFGTHRWKLEEINRLLDPGKLFLSKQPLI